MAESGEETKRKPIAFTVFVINFLHVGNVKSMGVLLPSLQDQFQTYTESIGAAVSLTFVSGSIIALLVQPLSRVYSIRSIVIVSGFISTTGLLICSMSSNIYVLVFGFFLAGFSSLNIIMAFGTLSLYFQKYYHLVTNIVTSAFPVGVIIFTAVTQYFIDIYGWRGTMALLGAIQFHTVAAALILKPIKQNGKQNGNPLPEETRATNNLIGSCLGDIFKLSLVQNTSFVVIAIAHSFLGYAENGWFVFFVSISLSKGLTLHQAAIVVLLGGVGCFITRITLAIFPNDHTRCLLYIGSVIMAAAYVGMYFASNPVTLAIHSCLFGVGFGIDGSLLYIAMNACVNQEDIYGAMSWMMLTESAAYLLSGFVTGWMFDLTGNFNMSIITQALVSFSIFGILGVEDCFQNLCLSKRNYIPMR